MDIGYDGQVTAHCNVNADRSFQSETALSPGGKPLAAEKTPYLVIPRRSSIFDARKHGIALGAAPVIVYKGKLAYAVVGDVGPAQIVGEAPYKVARLVGVDPDPATGDTASGVTYIVFRNTTVSTGKYGVGREGRSSRRRQVPPHELRPIHACRTLLMEDAWT